MEVDIFIPPDAPACVLFGTEDLEGALTERGLNVRRIHSLNSHTQIIIVQGTTDDEALSPLVDALNLYPLEEPESFVIRVGSNEGKQIVAIVGRDSVGCMYGTLEMAEQISGSDEGLDLTEIIQEKTSKPFLKIRGTNLFLTTQALTSLNSWYHSEDFWQNYFDMLARNRYNFVDIHGGYDLVTTTFPNLFHFLIKLEEYPTMVVDGDLADKNLKRFRRIVQMGLDRGITVGLMNYSVGERRTYLPPIGCALNAVETEDYTRKCVKKLFEFVPKLNMFGFRVGESGQRFGFYERTYFHVIDELDKDMRLYTRTWGLRREIAQEIGARYPGKFYVESKWVGEFLTLPYQGITGRRAGWSYDDYTDLPQNYEIIWQIRANGTHRFFQWGDPTFVRQTVRACKFGNGAGFSMEEITAYYPKKDVYHRIDHKYFDWMFQKYWLWYLMWGRIAYDPDISEEVFIKAYQKRMGEAGEEVYRAMVEISKIIPTIHSFHSQGLDHRGTAPEFETGNGWFAPQPKWLAPPPQIDNMKIPGDIDTFARISPLDVTIMQDIVEYVNNYLGQKPCGKMTPLEVGTFLINAADVALEHINNAEKLVKRPLKEFECLKMDIQALNSLAHYYQSKIDAAVDLQFFYQTNDLQKFSSALQKVGNAIDSWDNLAKVTWEHYFPFPEMLRMRTMNFSWKEEGKNLKEDLKRLKFIQNEFLSNIPGKDEPPALYHTPIARAIPSERLIVSTTVFAYQDNFCYDNELSSIFKTTLYYRIDEDSSFRANDMHRGGMAQAFIYRSAIPPSDVIRGKIEYYIESGNDEVGWSRSPAEQGKYYTIRVTSDRQKPMIKNPSLTANRSASSVTVTVEVTDDEGVESVYVSWKDMPSQLPWRRTSMKKISSNNYEIMIPATYHGLLYYFEAVDINGNAGLYPEYLKETPYLVFKGL